MSDPIVQSPVPLTLLGGGKARPAELEEALKHAPGLVAVDGGADFAVDQGYLPRAVIGDMDSVSPRTQSVLSGVSFHRIAEQNSTDFDKALRSVAAPLVLGVGFLGRRLDHQMANLNVLVRRAAQRTVLIGGHDIVFAAPERIALDLPAGSRVSLFPMCEVTGQSHGLHWPIDDLVMAPNGQVGTSNKVARDNGGVVSLAFDRPGMLVILPRVALESVVQAIVP